MTQKKPINTDNNQRKSVALVRQFYGGSTTSVPSKEYYENNNILHTKRVSSIQT